MLPFSHAVAVASPVLEFKLRPERIEDEPFLFSLYITTREDELALTGWDAGTRAKFLQMQFQAQRSGYAQMFPAAQFSIILAEGQPAGRIVVHRGADELRLVDLVLAPSIRGRGLGTVLLRDLIAESIAARLPLRLHVVRGNRALSFYARLGFIPIGESPSHLHMEYRATESQPCIQA